jgi:hypothetical protein
MRAQDAEPFTLRLPKRLGRKPVLHERVFPSARVAT